VPADSVDIAEGVELLGGSLLLGTGVASAAGSLALIVDAEVNVEELGDAGEVEGKLVLSRGKSAHTS
jgi:hypothetical protein